MGKLQNKVAVVTGGSTGIGFATAQRFVEEGAKVVITGRNEETLQAARQELGERVLALRSDASNIDDLDALFREVKTRFGRLDVLFLNAGVATFAAVDQQSPEAFRSLFDINVFGPFFAVQKALPLFTDGGSILFNTSALNTKGMAGAGAYSATKAALRSFVRTLTAELAPRGIRVNALSPGPVSTPIYGKTGMPQEQLQAFAAGIQQAIPLGRFGEPSELANAALFLASAEGSFVTGAELVADAGYAAV